MPLISLQPYVSGLTSPLLATNAKDGSRRLFIVQQGGIIKVVQPGSNTATDFMNITPRVLSGGERGLLGLAFHPQFATNGYFFVNYTRQTDGATVISRFSAMNSNTLGDPNSEQILLTIAQPFPNHNGGMIEFRNDDGVDNLYIGMGDGGSGNDPGNRAQNITNLLGKFLRITPNLAAIPTPPYTVPSDNPFVGVNGADEIYAIGVRNPFRWSFDRGGTRQLWAGDVGQNSIEEVDIITRGGNFGWRVYEGTSCTNLDPGLCNPANFIPPVFQYSSAGSRCSVTGGYVYRGTQNTLPDGAYIYGDYCTGEILMWDGNSQIPLIDTINFNVSSFGEDEDGELYVCNLSVGTVVKIVSTAMPTPTPTPTSTPTPEAVVSGRVTYGNSLTIIAVPSTTITAVGAIPLSTTTDSNGDYSLRGFGVGAYTITPSKANQVNGISNLDASTVAQHVAGLITLNDTQLVAADTSGNGAISSLDASYIAQFVASISNPSLTGTWKFLPASRSYSDVLTNQTGQNYSAILVGEVTGNWSPTGPLRFGLSTAESDLTTQDEKVEQQVAVTAQRNRAAKEKTGLTVDLTAAETTGAGILGYQLDVLYDASVIEPQALSCDVSKTISREMTAVCHVSEPGVLKVVVFGTTPISGAGILLKLKFKVVGARDSASPLTIKNFMFNEDLPTAVTVKGRW